jgi:hypothetical protein
MATKRSSETVAALLSSAPKIVPVAESEPPAVTAAPIAEPAPELSPELSPRPRRRRGPPPRPPKPIRFTLDLNRADHAFLRQFALAAEVDAARIMRELLDQLRNDKDLAQRVREKVWEQ